MKITMKAILINETDEQKSIIDNLMLVFCTAIRYSFKRLLEKNTKINELEKDVARKYNLNIRQSKDTVESARQIILSQKELVKQVILIAKTYGGGIAIEDLKFKNDKDVTSKFARIKHQFIYSKLLTMLESACVKEVIEIVKV